MNKQLVVIKLGGSLIADKTKPRTIKHAPIQAVSAEIAKLYNELDTDIILGTGGGSAHMTAHKYDCIKEARTKKQLLGMSLTHTEIRELNGVVASALHANKVPAFPLSPAGFMSTKGGILDTFYVEPLKILLKNGCIPVLHGETMCDSDLGGYAFSTEKIFNACLAKLRLDYHKITVIYAMDKAGILDSHGNVIPKIAQGEDIEVLGELKHDVTGGIVGKVNGAREALKNADQVYIVGGNTPGAIFKAANGLQSGTQIIG